MHQLAEVQTTGSLAHYYSQSQTDPLTQYCKCGATVLNDREADAPNDLAADLRQVRRVFQARLQDAARDAAFYHEQMDAIHMLMRSVDGMEQTLFNYWLAADSSVKTMFSRIGLQYSIFDFPTKLERFYRLWVVIPIDIPLKKKYLFKLRNISQYAV